MDRALRRHHKERIKKNRRHYWGRDLLNEDPKYLGMVATTPHPCSCYVCGNPRQQWNSETIQEKRSKQELQDAK